MVLTDFDADDWEREVKHSKGVVVVEFWHEGCVWCKALEPILSDISKDSAASAKFAKFNILGSEANMRLAQQFEVMGTPTVIIFCNGQPVQQLVGFRNRSRLEAELDEASSKCCIQ